MWQPYSNDVPIVVSLLKKWLEIQMHFTSSKESHDNADASEWHLKQCCSTIFHASLLLFSDKLKVGIKSSWGQCCYCFVFSGANLSIDWACWCCLYYTVCRVHTHQRRPEEDNLVSVLDTWVSVSVGVRRDKVVHILTSESKEHLYSYAYIINHCRLLAAIENCENSCRHYHCDNFDKTSDRNHFSIQKTPFKST